MNESNIDWFIPIKAYIEDRVVVAANLEKNYHHEFDNIEEAERFWKKIIALSASDSADPCWGNGKHFGDCTNQPITCNTCLIESTRAETKYVYDFFKKLVNEGYPQEVYKPGC